MQEETILAKLLVTGILLWWVLVWLPQAKVARLEREKLAARERDAAAVLAAKDRLARENLAHAERARQEKLDQTDRLQRARLSAKDRARRDAEHEKLRAERDAFLKSIRISAPDYILKARIEFEREYKASGSAGVFGHEMSPLVCFGYRVGKTNGRKVVERRAILKYSMAVDLDASLPFLPAPYRIEWGLPLSMARFSRMHHHLTNMADLRDGRRNYEDAVSDWRTDAAWLMAEQRPIIERFKEV